MKGIDMRIREDSPFHGITEAEKADMLVDADCETSHDDIAEWWENKSGRETTGAQVKRFLRRLRYEQAIRDAEGSPDLNGFAQFAADGKARDGMIEASKHTLFEEAIAEGNKELLLELYKAVNEERARERELAISERKAMVAEENAKLGWRRLELEQAKSALRLLPKVQEALTEGEASAEARLARIREIMMVGGAKLLQASEAPKN
jgi:hypothetical protein